MKKCNIYKENFESDSLQRHTVKSTRNSMNTCGFLFSVYTYVTIHAHIGAKDRHQRIAVELSGAVPG